MIKESLLLGTLWSLLEPLVSRLAESRAYGAFDELCYNIGEAWRGSFLVSRFCTPRLAAYRDEKPAGKVSAALYALYARIGGEKLFDGSVFLHCFFWCAVLTALAPLLPTMAVLGLAIVAYGATALRLLQDARYRGRRCPFGLPLVLYAAFYLLGTLTSADPAGSLYPGVLGIAFLFFSAVLFHAVSTERELDLLTALLVTAGAAVSCYGILQYVFRWGYQSVAWVDDDMFSTISFRASGTLQNPNMLGEYLLLMIPLGGAKLLSAKGVWRRLYYLACCGAMCLCMILTFSRGAWLGLLFAAFLFLALTAPRCLFLVPLALVALWIFLPETVVSRFTSIGNLSDSSTSYRVSIWLGTIDMLKDGHWLLGIGPGEAAFNMVYPKYAFTAVTAPHSHNLFLQILCDGGIGALLAFLWILIRYFRTLASALRREKDRVSRLMQVAFFSGMAGFLVQALTDYSFYNYRVMFLFWAYLALGALSARRSRLGREAEAA